MKASKEYLKLSIIMTDIFILCLAVIVILLPFGVSWYVEVMKRSQTLPATIMVTCYPCAPFTGAILLLLRRMLKRVYSGNILCDENSKDIKTMAICCLIIAVITLIAGRFYLPFYIVCGTFLFLALTLYALRGVSIALNERYGKSDL